MDTKKKTAKSRLFAADGREKNEKIARYFAQDGCEKQNVK